MKFPIVLTGYVEHGRKLGTSINIPTANIVPRENIAGLEYGVYYSIVVIDDIRYKSITNLGTKPTVKNSKEVNVESFIYDFSGDIYDKTIEVWLLEFKRPEKKFENVDALTAQMRDDLEAGRNYVSKI